MSLSTRDLAILTRDLLATEKQRPTERVAPRENASTAPIELESRSTDDAAALDRGRLLILMPKGLGRLGGLYEELGNLGWQTKTAEIDDRAIRYVSRAMGLRPTLAAHRRAYLKANGRLARTQLAFDYRTRQSSQVLAAHAGQIDCVLQIGGMWAPARPSTAVPYTLFCDCTVRLADGNVMSGVDFASRNAAARWYRRERELYHGAAAIFTASDYVRRSLIADYGVPSEKITIVGYGINLKAPEGVERSYDNQTMLFVGYEFERKGGPMLLEAFERVRCQLPSAQLIIAGPRRAPAVIPPGVTWAGTVDREQLARLYERVSLFVMPSIFEPFGLVYLEAMEWKLPCVGSASCAMPEIVLDHRNGRLVRPGDVDDLAQVLVDLLRDPSRLRAMGECGRAHARGRFPWPMVAGRVDEGLRRAVREVGRARSAAAS